MMRLGCCLHLGYCLSLPVEISGRDPDSRNDKPLFAHIRYAPALYASALTETIACLEAASSKVVAFIRFDVILHPITQRIKSPQ